MSETPIRIRIGASVDQSSIDRAFSAVEKRANKAQDKIRKEQEKAAAAGTRAQDKAATQQQKAAEKAAAAQIKELDKVARAAERAAAKETRAKERAVEKEIALSQRAAAKQIADQRRTQESFARRTSHRATRFLLPEAPIGSMAMRGLGGAVRGMGVDTNIASMFGRLGEQDRLALNLSNQGYLPNAEEGNKNRERVDPQELIKQSRGITAKYGVSGEESLGALGEYTKIAGDLNAAREALDDLAKLSLATGTNLADMAAAAGNVDMQLGNIPNKAKVVNDIMRTIAAQGKLGGVEIADFAVQMARVAASAGKFEGDTGENIKKFGALAQIARGTGGAPSAAEASRSVVGFTNTLKKGARLKEFDAAGVDVYNEKNQMRDPFKIIEESLVATNGDPRKMNKLFMDVVGERGISGLTTTFNRNGGNEGGGLEAVREQLAKFVGSATIGDSELEESARRAAETTQAKAEKFNAQMLEMTDRIRAKLIPALDENADSIIRFAEVIGSVATWAVENPKTAIAAAISASIARAGIESAMRTGIETLIHGAAGGGGGYSRTAGLMGGVGVAGNLAAASVIASLAVTTLVVGTAIIDQLFNKAQEEQRERVARTIDTSNMGNDVRQKLRSGDVQGALQSAKERVASSERDIEKTKEEQEGSLFGNAMKFLFANDDPLTRAWGTEGFNEGADTANAAMLEAQKRELEQSRAALQRIVELIEQQGGMMPGQSPGDADQ